MTARLFSRKETGLQSADLTGGLPPETTGVSFGWVAVVAVTLGLASAGLIGWATGVTAISVIYFALMMGAAAVAFSWASGRQTEPEGASRALVRAAIDNQLDAVAVTDRHGALVVANAAYGSICGGYPSPFELAGSTPDDRAPLERLAMQARRDGQARAGVTMVSGATRSELDVFCRRAGDPAAHLLWLVRPSERSLTLAGAVDVASGHVGDWLSQAEVGLITADGDGQVLAVNAACGRISGYEAGALMGRSLAALFTLTEDNDVLLRGADGSAVPVRLAEIPLAPQAGGNVFGYVYLLIKETPNTVVASGAAEDVAHGLLGSLPFGFATVDRDSRFRSINRAFTAAVGIKPEATPLYPVDLVHEEDASMLADVVRSVASGRIPNRDVQVRLRSGRADPIRLTITHVGLGDAAAILSLRDDAEQRRLQQQVTQATKMQAVGQLAGGIAHDFNNILTAIIGYCDLILLRHAPGDADFGDLNQIRQNANRAANLVRQLLAFSRQQTLRPQVLQVSDVLAELSNLLKRLMGETITLNMIHGRNLGSVRADPGQLEQVIVNLVVNGRDAMGGSGELTIRTYQVGPEEVKKLGYQIMPPADYVVMAVSDTGHGIAKEHLGKIFEPFFTTKEVGKGTGLGLSTVYGIVKQTGGFIFADSEVGRGTTFTIYLPVHTAAPEAQAAEEAKAKEAVSDSWGHGTVLLVEDEAMVRAVAKRALERKGYEVLTANNGEEALEVIEGLDEPVDLLISDVVMPSMDGPTLVRHARALYPDLKIIFISGYAEEQLRRSIDVPDVSFLPKPFSVQELAEAVREVISRKPAQNESTDKINR